MNHNCIEQSKLLETMEGEFDKSTIPTKYQNIKTKQVVNFVIENNQDLINCLDFLRYMMIDDIPQEVYDYMKSQNSDEIREILNEQFKDFHNKKLKNFLILSKEFDKFFGNFNDVDIKEFRSIFNRGDYVGENQFGLVISPSDISKLVFKDTEYEDENILCDRIYDKTHEIMKKKYPELFNENGKVIEEKWDEYKELQELVLNKVWTEEFKKYDEEQEMSEVYDDIHIRYRDKTLNKIYDSKEGRIPKDFMTDDSAYSKRRHLYQFDCFTISEHALSSVCCENELILKANSDLELYILYKKLLKQGRLPQLIKNKWGWRGGSTYIGWLQKYCSCT